MINGNLLLFVLSVVAVFALGMDMKNKGENVIVENYRGPGGMPQMTTIAQVTAQTPMGLAAVNNTYQASVIQNASDGGNSCRYNLRTPSINTQFAPGGAPQLQKTSYTFTPNPQTTGSNATLNIEPYRNLNMGCGQPRLGGDMKGQFFQPANFQGTLPPRMNPNSYPPYLRYAPPDLKHQGVPQNPLGYPNQITPNMSCLPCGGKQKSAMDYNKIVEGFDQTTSGCPPPDYRADEANFQKAMSQVKKSDVVDIIPIGTMETTRGEGDAEPVNSINYNRPMYSTYKTRLYSQSDFIRGDLPIVPCNRGWFTPSVNPARDLNAGALGAMGGIQNESALQTTALKAMYAGNGDGNTSRFAGLALDSPLVPGKGCDGTDLTFSTISTELGLSGMGGISGQTLYGSSAEELANPDVKTYAYSAFGPV